MLVVMPVAAQDDIPTSALPDSQGGSSLLDFMTFVIENDLHWYIFALIGLLVAGNLVPAAEIERRRERAKLTETPVDDAMVNMLEAVQMIKQMIAGMQPAPALTPSSSPAQSGSYVDELKKLNVPQSPLNPPATQGEIKVIVRQALDVPVNKNPKLAHAVPGNWGGEDKRAKDTPDGYSLAWQPYLAGDNFSPAPEIHRRDNGLDIAMAHRRGRLFIHQDVSGLVEAGQRYLLAVRCQCDLKLKADADIKGAIAIRAQLLAGEAVIRNLNAWSPENVEDLGSGFNALWAIEAGRGYANLSYQVLVEVGNIHAVPFDDLSKIVITAIELIPVAADYGNDNLVRF